MPGEHLATGHANDTFATPNLSCVKISRALGSKFLRVFCGNFQLMQLSLSVFLRHLRQACRLSQAQAARLAGIGRVTLNRWEAGVQQPRALDLEALLAALKATAQERNQALALLDTPQSRALLQSSAQRAVSHIQSGPMPHRGEMLRALRMRRSLTQESAAQKIGVAVRTLRRWENLEVWPSPTQLHTLFYALEARPEEVLALSTGRLSLMPHGEKLSLEELRARGHVLHFYTNGWQAESLKELSFLIMESQAWPLVAGNVAGRQVLAELYSYHAYHLSVTERFHESAHYANRAIDLLPEGPLRGSSVMLAGISAAQAAVHGGKRPAPQQGLEVLEHWIEMVDGPEYEAWLLSQMAEYTVQTGDYTHGVLLAQRATKVASRCENRHELYNRELDEARLLLQVNKPQQALDLIQRDRDRTFIDHPVKFRLLETSAYLGLNELALAHDRLQDALHLIDVNRLAHLQARAQELSSRF